MRSIILYAVDEVEECAGISWRIDDESVRWERRNR